MVCLYPKHFMNNVKYLELILNLQFRCPYPKWISRIINKCLQIVVQTLLMRSKLLVFIWEHAIWKITTLICSRFTACNQCSSLQLVFEHPLNLTFMNIWVCRICIYYPYSKNKIGLVSCSGIYDFDFPSIIKYLEQLTRDLFIVLFVDCQFDEIVYPLHEKEKIYLEKKT